MQIAHNGAEGLRQAYSWQPDLVLLDIMMPDMDGWTVCQRLREMNDVPIIFVTAVGQERNIVRGLQLGADDYIIKPFSTKELQARIEAVLRRHRQTDTTDQPLHYTNGWLTVDSEQRQVTVNVKPVDLSPIEFRLLTTLVRNEGKVLTHEYLAGASLGSGLQRRAPLPETVRVVSAPEDRTGCQSSAVHPDRARRGLSFCGAKQRVDS